MAPHSIILRAANPTIDEGLMFARYLDTAAEGFFRFMLGPRAAEIMAKAYMEPDNDFSFQHVTFAECDQIIVGMASGYSAAQHRHASDRPLKRAVGRGTLRMMGVAILCAPLLRFLNTHDDGDFYLQAIAIDKKHRGRGVGSMLLDAIEDRARATGSIRTALDVSAKNERARRLYQRRGMSMDSKWPRHRFMGQVIIRMAKSI